MALNPLSTVPLLIRSIHSAPLGIYPVRQLVEMAARLGYKTVGIADRESLAGVVELHESAARLDLRPLYAMEVFAGPGRVFPLILLALDGAGYRQLLPVYSSLGSGTYQEQGLAGLAAGNHITGAGLACLVEPPLFDLSPEDARKTFQLWGDCLKALFQHLPRARFYLRLPMPHRRNTEAQAPASLLDLAARFGLAPVILPLWAFYDPADAPLYALGRQIRLAGMGSDREKENPASLPAMSNKLFFSRMFRPPQEAEMVVRPFGPALENARRLTERVQQAWAQDSLHPPTIQLQRGFNPETYLWDQLQRMAEEKPAGRSEEFKSRLYDEFSTLRRQGKVELFLSLCELFARLSRPELVALPDKLTRGLLCAHLMGLHPVNPIEQGLGFSPETVQALESPVPLYVPDGLQSEIFEVLTDLFGDPFLAGICQTQMPSPAAARAQAAEHKLDDHEQAEGYLQRCARTETQRLEWIVILSRPVDAELPCSSGLPSVPSGFRLGLLPEDAIQLGGWAIQLIPEANRTRLFRLSREAPSVGSAGFALSEEQLAAIPDILPLLHPRFNRWVVRLAFEAIQPDSWTGLAAALALTELEQHDRTGFLRGLRALRNSSSMPRAEKGKPPHTEKQRRQMQEILDEGAGLFLYRSQLRPLFERIIGLPPGAAADLAGRILSQGPLLPPAEQLGQEVVSLLDAPDVGYLVTQYLSHLPRYLCPAERIYDWARNLAQFAALAEDNPLAFAREILNESQQASVEIPQIRDFLDSRGLSLLPPDVNRSREDSQIDPQGLRLGLSLVESIGPVTAAHIVQARSVRPFASLEELVDRTSRRLVNRRVLRCMAMSGALDDFGGRGTVFVRRSEVLRQIASLEKAGFTREGPDLQAYLFDFNQVEEEEASAVQPSGPSPMDLLREEARLFQVPVAVRTQRAVAQMLPVDLSMEPPSRFQRWMGMPLLQAGVFSDLWQWLEIRSGKYELLTLYSGDGCWLVLADSLLRQRLISFMELSEQRDEPTLVFVLGQAMTQNGKLNQLANRFFSLPSAPDELERLPHLRMIDFEPVQSVLEGAASWKKLEVDLDFAHKRLLKTLKEVLRPFRVQPGRAPGCFIRFRLTTVEGGGEGLQPLEDIPLLASQMLIRRLEQLEGVRSACFSEGPQNVSWSTPEGEIFDVD